MSKPVVNGHGVNGHTGTSDRIQIISDEKEFTYVLSILF